MSNLIETYTLKEMYDLSTSDNCKMKDGIIIYKDFPWVSNPFKNAMRCDLSAITLCTAGEMRMTVDTIEHRLRKGSLMIYGPYHVMEVVSISDDFTLDCVGFSDKFSAASTLNPDILFPIYKFIQDYNREELVLLDDKEYNVMRAYYSLISEVIELDNMMVIDYLLTAMMKTIRDVYQQRLPGPDNARTRHEEYFEKFMFAVLENYRHERSVQFYADTLRITPKYLSTVIKEFSGRSAMDWINDYVIQEAKQLLSYSKQSIQEITYHLNFSTQSFFGKYFKRHTGMSPSDFRSMAK